LTYLSDFLPKTFQFSHKLDDLALLKNQQWVLIEQVSNSKCVYIFRDNNELISSQNGRVTKGSWEYINNSTILIEINNDSYLMKHRFLDEDVFVLKIDVETNFTVFINETKYGSEINNFSDVVSFLKNKYFNKQYSVIDDLSYVKQHCSLGNNIPTYKEEEPIKQMSLLGIKYYTVRIHFLDSFTDFYHYYPKKNQFSFQKNYTGEVFFESKKECLINLYEDRFSKL